MTPDHPINKLIYLATQCIAAVCLKKGRGANRKTSAINKHLTGGQTAAIKPVVRSFQLRTS
jgi:hypothetical protein